jgi:hypothetical protein
MVSFNLGCYSALARNGAAAVDFLKQAIAIDKKYADMAKTDADFESIRTTPAFRDIILPPQERVADGDKKAP